MNKSGFNKLLNRIRLGDKEAMGELYDKLHSAIFTTAFMYLQNREDAEDIAEDVLWKIITYDGDTVRDPLGWIRCIIHNKCSDYCKKQDRVNMLEDIDVFPSIDSGSTADEILIVKESLSQLSPLEQTILIDHIFWGDTLKKISKDQGIAYITVKRKYSAIKEKLKNYVNS